MKNQNKGEGRKQIQLWKGTMKMNEEFKVGIVRQGTSTKERIMRTMKQPLTYRDLIRYFSDPAREKELDMPLVTTSSVNGSRSKEFLPVIGVIQHDANSVGIVIDKTAKED